MLFYASPAAAEHEKRGTGKKSMGTKLSYFQKGETFLQTFPFNLAHMLPLKFLTLTGPNCSLKHQLVLGWVAK